MKYFTEKVGRTYKDHRIIVRVFEPLAEWRRTDDNEGSYKPIMRATAYDVSTKEEIHCLTALLAISDEGDRQLVIGGDESRLPKKGIGSALLGTLLNSLCIMSLEDAWPVFIQFPDGFLGLRAKLRERFGSQQNIHPNIEMIQYLTIIRSENEYGLKEDKLDGEEKVDIVQFINGNNRLPIIVTTEAGYSYAKEEYNERTKQEVVELDFADSRILRTRLIGEPKTRKEEPIVFCRNLDALDPEQQRELAVLLRAGALRLIAAFFDHDNLQSLEGCKPPIENLLYWGRPFTGSVELG